jgi:hypothetical protein
MFLHRIPTINRWAIFRACPLRTQLSGESVRRVSERTNHRADVARRICNPFNAIRDTSGPANTSKLFNLRVEINNLGVEINNQHRKMDNRRRILNNRSCKVATLHRKVTTPHRKVATRHRKADNSLRKPANSRF